MMNKDLIKFFQAVSYAYSQWEGFPSKDNPIHVSEFRSSVVPSLQNIWGLSTELAEEAVEDAIKSYASKSHLTVKKNSTVASKAIFLASRIK